MAEAIQIFKRGRGEFNTCKLTRLVLDNKWEKEKWDKAWDGKETESEVPSVADLQENKKRKDTGGGGCQRKERWKM